MPIRLNPAPSRKVTIESLHDAVKDCYFTRVTAQGVEIDQIERRRG